LSDNRRHELQRLTRRLRSVSVGLSGCMRMSAGISVVILMDRGVRASRVASITRALRFRRSRMNLDRADDAIRWTTRQMPRSVFASILGRKMGGEELST
jgi:hypothetical protein